MIRCRGLMFRDEDDAYDFFRQRTIDEEEQKQQAQRAARREHLLAEAKRLFPGEEKHHEERRLRWVEAKLFIGDRAPKVRIGDGRETRTTFPRSLREAGITGEIA